MNLLHPEVMDGREEIIRKEIEILSNMIAESTAAVEKVQGDLTRLHVVRESLEAQLPEDEQLELPLDK